MESSTKTLRRLLDERGVEHEGGERSMRWRDRYGIMMQAFPLANGELGMGVWSCTPEQAIAATLEPGTCWLHDCDGSFSSVNRPVWRCDCGAFMTQYTDATTYHKPRFCPNCGRKVVDE